MKILTSSIVLDRSGVPTYTLTMCRELARLGHDVAVFTPNGGELQAEFEQFCKVFWLTSQCKDWNPDVVIAHHHRCAWLIRTVLPLVPMVYSAHGVLPECEQPPRDIQIDIWTAINEHVRDHLIAHHISPINIVMLRDFVDLEQFKPTSPADFRRDRPRVLFVSNYKRWKNYAKLAKACDAIGFDLKAVGAPYGRSRMIDVDMNRADVVVTWGRGILEAMACGRAAFSYDKEIGDGLMSSLMQIVEARQHNFGTFPCRHWYTETKLARHLREVRNLPDDYGSTVRQYVADEHDVRKLVPSTLMTTVNIAINRRACSHVFRDTTFCVYCGWQPLSIH